MVDRIRSVRIELDRMVGLGELEEEALAFGRSSPAGRRHRVDGLRPGSADEISREFRDEGVGGAFQHAYWLGLSTYWSSSEEASELAGAYEPNKVLRLLGLLQRSLEQFGRDRTWRASERRSTLA